MRTGIGIADHSGWAVLVAVGGDAAAPQLILRRRLRLVDERLPRQVYHAVAEQGRPRSLIPEVLASAAAESERELSEAIQQLHAEGHEARGIAIAGRPDPPPPLERILASHALLHGAEGQLYRDALAEVATGLGLHVRRFIGRELGLLASTTIGLEAPTIESYVAATGKAAGPPWTVDQKRAATAAWLALAAQS